MLTTVVKGVWEPCGHPMIKAAVLFTNISTLLPNDFPKVPYSGFIIMIGPWKGHNRGFFFFFYPKFTVFIAMKFLPMYAINLMLLLLT